MVNAELHTLLDADGLPVSNVSFDLSDAQLDAATHAVGEVRHHRHRGQEMTTDDVLALRELTALGDELERLREQHGHATLVLPLARLVTLHDAIVQWLANADERGWMRGTEQETYALLDALQHPMADLRAEAVHATLAAGSPSHGS
jgi:hypothetical protein